MARGNDVARGHKNQCYSVRVPYLYISHLCAGFPRHGPKSKFSEIDLCTSHEKQNKENTAEIDKVSILNKT